MTEEEKQELETLRQEKRQALQRQRATAALEKAGVSTVFADLLVGCSAEDTDQRTASFCSAYQQALSADVRQRLPQQPPVVVESPLPQRPRRGIQRLR